MPSPELTNSNTHDNCTTSNLLDNTKIQSTPTIIPIDTDKEDLENLKELLASSHTSDKEKAKILKRITGACVTCAGISEYYLIYDLNGCSKIESYCSPCIEKIKVKGN